MTTSVTSQVAMLKNQTTMQDAAYFENFNNKLRMQFIIHYS